MTPDGRVWRYCEKSGAAAVAGNLQQSSANDANQDELVRRRQQLQQLNPLATEAEIAAFIEATRPRACACVRDDALGCMRARYRDAGDELCECSCHDSSH